MRSPLTTRLGFKPYLGCLIGICASLALTVFEPDAMYAQTGGSRSKSSSNPSNPANVILGRDLVHRPDGSLAPLAASVNKRNEATEFRKEALPPSPNPCDEQPCWWSTWSFDFATLYDFSNQRSTVGNASLNLNYVGIDLTASACAPPYTSFDFIYAYSHGTGSSAGGTSQVVNQYSGAMSILQPLNYFFRSSWKPADLSCKVDNQQWAIIMESLYGGAPGSTSTPNFPIQHFTQETLVQDALLDYQRAVFPERKDYQKSAREYSYPNWTLDLSTGIQFTRLHLDSSGGGSSGKQLDYLNSVNLSYSFKCMWGFLVGVEWDAPFYSEPVHNAKPYHANTAVFTGGIVYNLYPNVPSNEDKSGSCKKGFCDPRRWSLSLLYSYTAFDPSTQTNTVELRISYALF
jgi:hypothetical protein